MPIVTGERYVRRWIFLVLAIALLGQVSGIGPAVAGHRVVADATPAAGGSLQLFATEAEAQQHCPKDEVVWLNTSSGIYHEKGMRWYGNTRHGAYVCRKEADADGDRDTRNGQ